MLLARVAAFNSVFLMVRQNFRTECVQHCILDSKKTVHQPPPQLILKHQQSHDNFSEFQHVLHHTLVKSGSFAQRLGMVHMVFQKYTKLIPMFLQRILKFRKI